jgi:hypothetical protein
MIVGVVLSSTLTESDDQAEPTPKEPIDAKTIENPDSPVVVPPEAGVSPAVVENHHEETPPLTGDAQTTLSGNFLATVAVPMGRSSR